MIPAFKILVSIRLNIKTSIYQSVMPGHWSLVVKH